jgi:hypothetical protein
LYAKVCYGKHTDHAQAGGLPENHFFDATIALFTRLTIALLFESSDNTNLTLSFFHQLSILPPVYEYQTFVPSPKTVDGKAFHEMEA